MKIALLSLLALAQADPKTSAVRGSISPAAEVRLVLKSHQRDLVQGETVLPKGGDFAFENVPPGKYDLLIRPVGVPERFLGTRWVLTVEAGKPVTGLSTRLTPEKAKAMVDEILVRTRPGMSEAEQVKLVESLGGKIMNPSFGGWILVDLPDDHQAEETVAAFKARPEVVDATLHRIRMTR